MRIVILTPIPFWHPGTSELLSYLKKNNIEVVVLDIFKGIYISNELEKEELSLNFLFGFAKKIYVKLLRKRFIRKHLKDGDIIDMHYVNSFYSHYLDVFFEKKIKLIATFFGSDLYRPTHPKQYKWQSKILKRCTSIVMGVNMFVDFEKQFPNLKSKVFYNQYGSTRIDLIKNISTPIDTIRRKYNISLEKTIITIGYNAKKEQQHLFLLSEILKLPDHFLNKLTLLLPITYGREISYLCELKQYLKKSQLDFILFEKYLSDNDLSEIRIISDITLNAQTTDVLSSSLKEAFIAKNIVMVGDWLPYAIYEDLDIYFIRSGKEDWYSKLFEIINNIEKYKKLSRNNGEKIYNFSSWNKLIKIWLSFYTNL